LPLPAFLYLSHHHRTLHSFPTRRSSDLDNNSNYVFTSELTKRPFSTRRIMQIIDDLSERAGVKGVTTHSFRSSKATDLVENGVPIEYVSENLGHSSIETTKIYTDLTRKLHEKVGKFQMSL